MVGFHTGRDPLAEKCVFPRGADASDYYGFHKEPRDALLALALIAVAFRFLAFLAFKYLFVDHPIFRGKPLAAPADVEPAGAPAAPEAEPLVVVPEAEAPAVARDIEAAPAEAEATVADVVLCNT